MAKALLAGFPEESKENLTVGILHGFGNERFQRNSNDFHANTEVPIGNRSLLLS